MIAVAIGFGLYATCASAATVSFAFTNAANKVSGSGNDGYYASGATFRSASSVPTGTSLLVLASGYSNTGNLASPNYSAGSNSALYWTAANGLGVKNGKDDYKVDAEKARAEGLKFDLFSAPATPAAVTLSSLTLGFANVGEAFRIRITSDLSNYTGDFTIGSVSGGNATITLSGDVASRLVSSFRLEAIYDSARSTAFTVNSLAVVYEPATPSTSNPPTTSASVPLPPAFAAGAGLMAIVPMGRRVRRAIA